MDSENLKNIQSILKYAFQPMKFEFQIEEAPFSDAASYAKTVYTPQISKSDCALVRGIFSTTDPLLQVGFDVEVANRISPQILNRVVQNPDPKIPLAIYWSSIEAAFKSLHGPEQPQTISQIQIEFQNRSYFQLFALYQFKLSPQAYPKVEKSFGISFQIDQLAYAFLILRKNIL